MIYSLFLLSKPIIFSIIKILTIIIPLLVAVAYLTYFERKVIAFMQLRKGPNIVGPFGLLQPIADALKLIFKEIIIPKNAYKKIFLLAPLITFILSMIGFAVIPYGPELIFANIDAGILFLFAISSLEVYGIIMAGWASNSKYAFLGAIRSSAQMISYEISMGIIVICILLISGSLNLSEIVESSKYRPLWLEIMLIPLGIVFFISVLAETNRHPFDLPEAEAELVAGYNVEYSSMSFALFFLAEYANMILVSAITTIFFLGGYLPPFNLDCLDFMPPIFWFISKIYMILFCFLWIRATTPRFRYDQLMRLGWKIFLPFTLLWVVIISYLFLKTNIIT